MCGCNAGGMCGCTQDEKGRWFGRSGEPHPRYKREIELEEKVARLEGRGIEDLRHQNEVYRSALQRIQVIGETYYRRDRQVSDCGKQVAAIAEGALRDSA